MANDPDSFPLLDRFLGYFQAIRERSQLTIREYRYDLCLFFRWLKIKRQLTEANTAIEAVLIADVTIDLIRSVTLTDLYDYVTWLSRERGLMPSSRARKIASLRSFFHYLHTKEHLLTENIAAALESPKQIRRLPRYLSVEESKNLLQAAADSDSPLSARDYCILTLFLNCGLRLSELCGINLRSIREEILVVLGKGKKERTVYLNGACLFALEQYLAVRPHTGKTDPDALFISRLGGRISNKMVQVLIKNYICKAGLDPKRYSTHKLRHTAATLMYQYGQVDIRALQQILGHSSIATTEIYTHVDDRRLHQAVESNPLSTVRPNT
jgi:site-specific recombinase XerD